MRATSAAQGCYGRSSVSHKALTLSLGWRFTSASVLCIWAWPAAAAGFSGFVGLRVRRLGRWLMVEENKIGVWLVWPRHLLGWGVPGEALQVVTLWLPGGGVVVLWWLWLWW